MKLSITQNQFFDDAGRPLSSGTVSIYYHDSDTLATVYYLEGDDYVDAPNPLTCSEDGRIPTVFFDATVVDVVVKDALGQVMDTFQTGFYVDDARNATSVEGIAALKAADPSLGFVTVVGYDQYVQAPARTYVWDANCPTTPDNGVVVESTVAGANGAWVLLWDWRELPVSIYGVKPGHEANISAAIGYAQSVGTFGLRTPPVVRFPGGTYGSNTTYTTSKVLSFDTGAKFTNATFSAPAIEVTAQQTSYVADFVLTKKQARVESSWFRTAQAFFKCGAAELHQSPTNYFTSTALDTSFTISGARISGAPVTLTGSGWYMALDGCDIAPRSLSSAWTLKFLNCTFMDRWYTTQPTDTGLVPTHKLQAKISDGCVLDVDNFQWPDLYYKLAIHNSLTTLDMRGKAINEVEAGHFAEIKNATINECHVEDDTIITNCIIGDLDADSGNVSIYDSRVVITDCTPFELNVFRSSVQMNCDIDTFATKVISEDSTWELKEGGATYHRIGVQSIATSNYTYDVMVGFTRCHIDNGTINGNVVSIADCVISGNCNVRAFPKKVGADFLLNVRFDRNTLSGTSSLVISPGPNGTDNTDVYNVGISLLHIEGNIFGTTDTYGLRMPFYANDGLHRFMKGSCTTTTTSTTEYGEWAQPWTYRNNSGNCPSETIPTIPDNDDSTDEEFYTTFTYSIGNNALSRRVFCIPTEENDWGSMSPGGWSLGLRGKRLAPLNNFTLMKDADFEDQSFPAVALFPDIAMGNNARPGDEADDDMFTVRFACIDTIKSLTFRTWPVPV